MHLNFSKDQKVIRVAASASAATTAVDTDVVDMQGFESIAFIALLGDVTNGSVLTLTGKTNTASSTSSPTPTTLVDTATFTADASSADDKVMVLDLHRPRDRYVFASLTRTTANAAVDGVLAVLYNANQVPITDDASVIASTFANDPASA